VGPEIRADNVEVEPIRKAGVQGRKREDIIKCTKLPFPEQIGTEPRGNCQKTKRQPSDVPTFCVSIRVDKRTEFHGSCLAETSTGFEKKFPKESSIKT